MKIALHETKSSTYSDPSVIICEDWIEDKNSDYVRVSEIEEVEFILLDRTPIILAKIAAIRAEKCIKMQEFDDKISKLLSIEHKPEAKNHEDS